MFEKVKECWHGCPVVAKVLTIAAPILLIIVAAAEILLIFEVLATDLLRAVIKISVGILWALIGPVWWKSHRLFSAGCFVISLVYTIHAIMLFLR
jgi:hypothetical protein